MCSENICICSTVMIIFGSQSNCVNLEPITLIVMVVITKIDEIIIKIFVSKYYIHFAGDDNFIFLITRLYATLLELTRTYVHMQIGG